MEERFPYPAVRQSHLSGFALLELLVSVCVIAVMTLLTMHAVSLSSGAYFQFPLQYTRLKSEALLTGERCDYEDSSEMDYPSIYFQENGTVNQARTLSFPRGDHTAQIVIELGPGALVFK